METKHETRGKFYLKLEAKVQTNQTFENLNCFALRTVSRVASVFLPYSRFTAGTIKGLITAGTYIF